MTKRDILSIALKITGIVFLIRALIDVPIAIYTINSYLHGDYGTLENTRWVMATTAAYPVIALLAACFIIAWSDEISRRLVSADSEISIRQLRGNEPILFSMALRVVGVVVVVQAIPSLLQTIMGIMLNAYKLNNSRMSSLLDVATSRNFTNEWAIVISQTLALAIGIYLVLGAKQITGYILRNRTPA